MDATELAFAGIARQAEMIANGEVASRELVELYLDRIARLDARLNAFRVVWGERALEEADEADRRRAAGARAHLLGVPVAVKDVSDVAGDVTGFGTGGFDHPAPADSEIVARLRAAGAVLIGKLNLPELAIYGFTESRTWGATHNPWDPGRTPGARAAEAARRSPPGSSAPPRAPTEPARSASRQPTAGSSGSSLSAAESPSRRSPSTGTG
jgi:amidase